MSDYLPTSHFHNNIFNSFAIMFLLFLIVLYCLMIIIYSLLVFLLFLNYFVIRGFKVFFGFYRLFCLIVAFRANICLYCLLNVQSFFFSFVFHFLLLKGCYHILIFYFQNSIFITTFFNYFNY